MDTTAFPPDVQPLIDKVLAICREQMTEGTVTPVTYVIESKSRLLVPVEMHMPDNVAKDISAALVRMTAKSIKADMTIMVTEAWSLSAADAARHAEIVEQYGSIGEYPGKLDILMVTVQTRAGHWMARAPIETRGQARRCGELEVMRAEGAAGRFTNFLGDEDA